MKKWLHIIGVAGVTTSGLALMFQKIGWKVTGSAKGFFPPVSTYLKENGFNILIGYKEERLTDEFGKHPNLVLYQGLENPNNPELVEAHNLKLKISTYPEIIRNFIIKENASIVVAGSYGKTSITATLIEIFLKSKLDFSYMVGGLFSKPRPTAQAKSPTTTWSIVEGDEYLVSLDDKTSKFFKYGATHLILNSVEWDHLDLFTTESSYIENYIKLISQIPPHGLIVANANDKNVVKCLEKAKCRIIYYSTQKSESIVRPDWYIDFLSKPDPTFIRNSIGKDIEIIPYRKSVLGKFNNENLLAAAVLAYEIGIRKERIQEGIESFAGIKRRLEIRFENSKIKIIDDFGSSLAKAKGALETIREEFPNAEIVSVFEPSTGNRTFSSLELYNNTFNSADEVILPRFTKLPLTKEKRFLSRDLYQKLNSVHPNVKLVVNDQELVDYLYDRSTKMTKTQLIIVFLGSHSFRNMIELLVEKLNHEKK